LQVKWSFALQKRNNFVMEKQGLCIFLDPFIFLE